MRYNALDVRRGAGKFPTVLCFLLFCMAGAKPVFAQVTLFASPAQVLPGQTVNLTAIGLYPFGSETASFYVSGSPNPFSVVTLGAAQSTATASYTVPANQMGGVLTFTARDSHYGAAANATVTVYTAIDTDAMTINGSSAMYHGVPMTAQSNSGETHFVIAGDAVFSGPIVVTGGRALVLISTNNMTLTSDAVLDVSAHGTAAVSGGAGGAGAAGGSGQGQGNPGGFGGAYGYTQSNGYLGFASGAPGTYGASGTAGQNGNSANGHDGYNGSNTFGSGGSGGGGGSAGGAGSIGAGGAYDDYDGIYSSGVPSGSAGGGGGNAGGAGGVGGNGGNGGGGRQSTNTTFLLIGGGSGGSGGSGGQGGGGGSGGGGGGGGGGQTAQLGAGGAAGGNGGNGGNGGSSSSGGAGGTGGAGGAGGGAVLVAAYGRLTVAGTLLSLGGGGSGGTAGLPGGAGNPGANGVSGDQGSGSVGAGNGGAGGNGAPNTANGNPGAGGGNAQTVFVGGGGGGGGQGGGGGNGGTGGNGGSGGGGAGGSILLQASVVNSAGSSFNAQGGNGANAGANGRVLIGQNNAGSFAGTVSNASLLMFPGVQNGNGYLSGVPATPYIPDLPAISPQHPGAQLYGLSGLSSSDLPPSVASGANGSPAALYRVHIGPKAPVSTNFPGFDYVFFVSLGNALNNPTLGIGPNQYDLVVSAADYNAPGGVVALNTLPAGAAYVTMVPSGTTANFNASVVLNGNTYTVNNAPLANGEVLYFTNIPPTASLAGAALAFDGVSSAVSVGAKFGSVANNFTMECWVNPSATISLPPQSTSGINGESGQRYALYPTQSGLNYGAGNSGAGISVGTNGVAVYEHSDSLIAAPLVYSATITAWTHLAVVYTNGAPSLYVNGTLAATGLRTGLTAHPSADMSSGAADGSNSYGYYAGQMDEVRIWNIARPASRILADVNASLVGNEPGLVAYYKLDEGKGTTAHDSTASHYDGTVNGATWAASGAPINTIHVLYGVPRPFTPASFDPNGLTDTFSIVTKPAQGTITGSSPNFTYTPGASYNGSDTFTYTASNTGGASNVATVKVNFGVQTASLTGTLTFNDLAASAANQNVTFQFRDPNSGAVLFTRTASVPAAGAFSLPYAPLQNYTLWIKPDLFLAQTVSLAPSANAFPPVTKAFDGGDANDDNSVDSTDFGILIGAFGSEADITGSGYDIRADFNGDGFVDSTDFGILIGNFNETGAP